MRKYHLQDEVVNSFTISLDAMKDISSKLTEEFKTGLAREGEDVVVKMLITYVHSLPDGTEKGDFLALDLGGSNFRVLLISNEYNKFRSFIRTKNSFMDFRACGRQ